MIIVSCLKASLHECELKCALKANLANSNEACPHAMRIAICSVNHACSMRIAEWIIGC